MTWSVTAAHPPRGRGAGVAQVGGGVAEAGQAPVEPGRGRLGHRAVVGEGGRRDLVAEQGLQQLHGLGGGQPLVVLGVDLDHRGAVAGGQALDLLDGDHAALVGAAEGDLQPRGHGLGDLPGPAELAGQRLADRDQVLPHRAAPEHGVEGGHRPDLGLGQPQQAGRLGDTGRRHVAVLRLQQEQDRQQGRARLGVARDQLLGPGQGLVGQGHGGGGLLYAISGRRRRGPGRWRTWRR